MEDMKMYCIEGTVAEKNDTKSDEGIKRCVEILSRIMVIMYSLIFVWVFGHTLNTINSDKNENFGATNLTHLSASTKELTPNKGRALLFGYDADLVITNIASCLAVAFSVLAVIGIHKRSATMLLIWFISALALFGLPILVNTFVWEGEVTPAIFFISYIFMFVDAVFIFMSIRYYTDMVKEDSEIKNPKKFKATVAADPEYFTIFISDLVSKFSKSPILSNERTVCSITWREK